jgi:DNA replication protein DnaC
MHLFKNQKVKNDLKGHKMERIFADINQKWEPLSDGHEKLVSNLNNILETFLQGEEIHPSYLITGVFGAGKTLFLYHILKESLNKGMLPIFVLAGDLFERISAKNDGEVMEELNRVVEGLKDAFRERNFSLITLYVKSMPSDQREKLINYYVIAQYPVGQNRKI